MRRIGRVIRKVHKWSSIVVGAFILVWLVSGIAVLVPERYVSKLEALVWERAQEMETGGGAEAELPGFADVRVSVPIGQPYAGTFGDSLGAASSCGGTNAAQIPNSAIRMPAISKVTAIGNREVSLMVV